MSCLGYMGYTVTSVAGVKELTRLEGRIAQAATTKPWAASQHFTGWAA